MTMPAATSSSRDALGRNSREGAPDAVAAPAVSSADLPELFDALTGELLELAATVAARCPLPPQLADLLAPVTVTLLSSDCLKQHLSD